VDRKNMGDLTWDQHGQEHNGGNWGLTALELQMNHPAPDFRLTDIPG